MKEKYDKLKMEIVAFEEGVWIATIDATAVSNGSGRQGGQNTLVDPTTGTVGDGVVHEFTRTEQE